MAKESLADIMRLLREQEAEFVDEFLSMVAAVRRQLNFQRVIEMLGRGDFEQAINIVEEAAERMGVAYDKAFRAGVQGARDFIRRNANIVLDFHPHQQPSRTGEHCQSTRFSA